MSGKILKFGADARQRMLSGIDELERAVTVTLGPKGRNALFDRGTSHPIITKDGVSVAREVSFSDHYKNAGACIVKEAAEKANAIAGDGTTTTVLLASQLCKEGVRLVGTGCEPVELQKGMDLACRDVKAALKKYTKVLGTEDILHIATISANNDVEAGQVVYDAFTSIGEGGIVNIQDSHSKSGKTTVKCTDGMEFPSGLTDGRFTNNKKDEVFEVEDAYVILFDFEPTLEDAQDALNLCYRKSKPIVLIAPSFAEDVESMCVNMSVSKKMKCACVKAPGFSSYSTSEQIKDLAVVFGTRVIADAEDAKSFHKTNDDGKSFGRCKKITSTMFKTTITEGGGSDDEIDARVKEIEKEIADGKADEDRGLSEEEETALRGRIARLSGGIATIMVGGLTETRIKELKDRFEDAVHAVQAAITNGIVIGGGCALLKASSDVKSVKKKFPNDSFEAGYNALLKVCREPALRIIGSVTSDAAYLATTIEKSKKTFSGYNAKAERLEDDMFAAGVIDPFLVECTALEYATSVAGIFITTECVVTNEAQNISFEPLDPVSERIDSSYGAY